MITERYRVEGMYGRGWGYNGQSNPPVAPARVSPNSKSEVTKRADSARVMREGVTIQLVAPL